MAHTIKRVIQALSLLLVVLSQAGCGILLDRVPTVPPLPTLTPSPAASPTAAVAPVTEGSPATPAPTVVLPLLPTPTFPIAATPSPGQLPGAQGPSIAYFVATPERAEPGEPVVLIWSALNASAAAVYRLTADGEPGQTWAVAVEGSLTIQPGGSGQAETYVLAVTNGVATVEQSITVEVACPFAWFFTPAPEGLCPQAQAVLSAAVVQQFERGQMIWLETTDEILVLFNDAAAGGSVASPAWLALPDPYEEGDLLDDPGIVPPPGLFQPQHGFGEVWRTIPTVRDRLGWATQPEEPFVTTSQGAQVDAFIQRFFAIRTGEVLTLLPDGQGWLVAGSLP
jgi:hypothetical protein